MEFKIPKETQRFIAALRAGADILDAVDMDDHAGIHGEDQELIDAIYIAGDEMRRIADETEWEQIAMLDTLKAHYDANYK